MSELPLPDPLLAQLRRARPDEPDRLADDPGAVALLERIVSIESDAHDERARIHPSHDVLRRRPGRVPLRRVAIGSAAAAVVAAAVVAGLGITGTGGHQPTGTGTLGIQAVAQRTRAALTAAVTQYVEYSVTKTAYPQTASIPARTRYEWSSGTRTNIEVVNPSGTLLEELWYSGSAETPRGVTEVLYPTHAWWTRTVAIDVTQVQDITGPDIAARIQSWVSAGQLSVVGTPTLGGKKTIEVSGDALTLGQIARTLPAATASTRQFDLTMWLDPSTYLPVQLNTTYTTPAATGRTTSTTSSVNWLPATTANLAKLQGQIPAGFTHLTDPPSIATGSLPTTAK